MPCCGTSMPVQAWRDRSREQALLPRVSRQSSVALNKLIAAMRGADAQRARAALQVALRADCVRGQHDSANSASIHRDSPRRTAASRCRTAYHASRRVTAKNSGPGTKLIQKVPNRTKVPGTVPPSSNKGSRNRSSIKSDKGSNRTKVPGTVPPSNRTKVPGTVPPSNRTKVPGTVPP